eukprot:5378954-Amphidinium_carterae.1
MGQQSSFAYWPLAYAHCAMTAGSCVQDVSVQKSMPSMPSFKEAFVQQEHTTLATGIVTMQCNCIFSFSWYA